MNENSACSSSSSSSVPRDFSQLAMADWTPADVEAWANKAFEGYNLLRESLRPLIENGKFHPSRIQPDVEKENILWLQELGISNDAHHSLILFACEEIQRGRQLQIKRNDFSSRPAKRVAYNFLDCPANLARRPPGNFCSFWQALQAVDWKESDQFITLPSEAFWGNDISLGRKPLFIRDCYRQLFQSIVSQPKRRKLGIVLGNPGNGKTYFLYYLMAKLAKDPEAIIIHHKSNELAVLYHSHGVLRGSLSQLYSLVEKSMSSVYYLIDGRIPYDDFLQSARVVILVTAPNREIYKEFEKRLTCQSIHYLPIWSWEEISLCHSIGFPEIPREILMDLYDKFGGIPRYLLQQGLRKYPYEEFRYLFAIRLEDFTHGIGQIRNREDFIHLLIHLVTDSSSDYYDEHVEIASVYISQLLSYYRYCYEPDNFLSFLSVNYGYPGDEGLIRKQLFAGLAHQMLRRGGNFLVRNLEESDSSAVEEFQFPQSPKEEEIVFPSFEALKELPAGQYARPLSKSFFAFDSFVSPNLIIRMAGYRSDCSIDLSTLEEFFSALPDRTIRIFFAVPERAFSSFKKQKISVGKTSTTTGNLMMTRNIQQWAIRIPLNRKEIHPNEIRAIPKN